MKKSAVFFLLTTLCLLGICGCAANHTNSPDTQEPEVTLSERQKSILSEQGLPLEYTELPPHQQRAIVAVEEMLSYAEDKYDMSFSYAGYTAAGPMEKEHMNAYPTAGHKEVDCFTITKTGEGYEDDFIAVATAPYFASYIHKSIQPFLPDTGIKVYAHITRASLSEVPTEETCFDGKIGSALYVFVDGESCPLENMEQFQAQLEAFLYEHELYGSVEVTLLKERNFLHLSKFNFADYFSSDCYDSRETIYIRR